MRVLHVVKTTNGAAWAAWQAAELIRAGVEVHVALPDQTGLYVDDWRKAGAIIHVVSLNFPTSAPWKWTEIRQAARELVADVRPDLIHSHFVGTTVALRLALGKHHPVKRLFQVPGPLHLEHNLFRTFELSTAGPMDYWVCSSLCIWRLLREHGIREQSLFTSYYGWYVSEFSAERTYALRTMLGIDPDTLVVGNICWMYPPKYHLGHLVGLKCHEDIIEALAIVTRKRKDVVGVLAGGPYRGAGWYEARLRARAQKAAGNRIRMPGHLDRELVRKSWPDFDCAVHVPLSENCGGAPEPLLAGVPVIAADVGGLPEVIIDTVTGKIVPPRNPRRLADAVLEVLEDAPRFKVLAKNGERLIRTMFDVRRTAHEILSIYRHLLDPSAPRPDVFDSRDFLREHS